MMIESSKGGESLLSRKISEVREIHGKAMMEECRIWLLKSLQSKHLCTRDIYSFISNQAKLKSQDDILDSSISRSAMRSKILDLRRSLFKIYKLRRKRENELLELLGNKGYSLRKNLRKIRSDIKKDREKIMKTYRSKIEHYVSEQRRCGTSLTGTTELVTNFKPTVPPRFLGEFSTLTIFGSPGDLPRPAVPRGPFICDHKIKLTKHQRMLLSREPKFSLVNEPTEMQFKTEIERMTTKHRMNEHAKNKKKTKIDTALANMKFNDNGTMSPRDINPREKHSPPVNEKIIEDNEREVLYKKFEETKARFIFNPLKKTLNFNKKRVTDYKLNKHIILPKPLGTDSEFECEVRRRQYLAAFNKYKKIPVKIKKTSLRGSYRRLRSEKEKVSPSQPIMDDGRGVREDMGGMAPSGGSDLHGSEGGG